MARAAVLLASLLLAGCAGPFYGGPSLDGTWRATDAELGSMSVVIAGDDAVITAVDGQRFELDGTLAEADGAGELRGTLEAGRPGLMVLFGPKDTNDVEGTINFRKGLTRAVFRRRGQDPFLDARFSRTGADEAETLKTIRLTQVPGTP